MENFHDKLSKYINDNNIIDSRDLVLRELGRIIVKNKADFVALLNQSGIAANENMSEEQLIDIYVSHIVNRKLLLGTALLVNSYNKTSSSDGTQEISDDGVKLTYEILTSSFDGTDDYSEEEESGADGGVIGAIAGAVSEGAKLGGKITENQRAKKFGAQDMLAKKTEAKSEITKAVLAERQAKIEADKKSKEQKAKTTRTILIVSGIVVGLGILGAVIYYVRKSKK